MIFKIDSNSRSSGTIYNFKAALANPLPCGDYVIDETAISNSYYNINASNNTISFTSSATPYVATIAPGFYTLSTIAAAVQTALNAALSNSFVVTIGGATQLLTITGTTAFSITAANSLLGLGVTGSATSQTGTSIININPTRSYNIIIDGVISETYNAITGFSYAFIIPIATSSGGFQNTPTTGTSCQIITLNNPIKTISVSVVDDANQPIVLQTDWYITLRKVD